TPVAAVQLKVAMPEPGTFHSDNARSMRLVGSWWRSISAIPRSVPNTSASLEEHDSENTWTEHCHQARRGVITARGPNSRHACALKPRGPYERHCGWSGSVTRRVANAPHKWTSRSSAPIAFGHYPSGHYWIGHYS